MPIRELMFSLIFAMYYHPFYDITSLSVFQWKCSPNPLVL